MTRRWAIGVILVALAIGFGVGVAVWAVTSTREDVDSNAVAIKKANAAAVKADEAAAQANRAIAAIDREGRDRRDQSCRGLELSHKQEIVDLTNTYRFYADPPPQFRGLFENPLVQEQVRDRERDAKNDQDRYGVFVPAYCDERGIGLKEPDPKIPRRPKSLR